MRKLVWDTSAIINLKEPNADGYSPAASLYKDFNDGWIPGPYLNIFPALAVFEVAATVSRKHRDGFQMRREFYLIDDHSVVYNVDEDLIRKSYALLSTPGFDRLHGADLIFACIAYVESATLVTRDLAFNKHVGHLIDVLDLTDSVDEPLYRSRLLE